MFKQLLSGFTNSYQTADAEEVRRQLQSIFFKIKTFHKHLHSNKKLKFKIIDTIATDTDSNTSGQITFFLGAYAVRYEMDQTKSIQLFRRGKVDNLQFAELLAISFFKKIDYITDQLFVKADLHQLENLINHVITSRSNLNTGKSLSKLEQ